MKEHEVDCIKQRMINVMITWLNRVNYPQGIDTKINPESFRAEYKNRVFREAEISPGGIRSICHREL